MINLKVIRHLKYNGRTYVHYMKNVDISYISNDRNKNIIKVNLHVGGWHRKFDAFEIMASNDNFNLLDRLGKYGLSDTKYYGTLIVEHDTGEMTFVADEYIELDNVDAYKDKP